MYRRSLCRRIRPALGVRSLVPPWWDYAVGMNGEVDRDPGAGVVDVWFQTVGGSEASKARDDLALLSADESELHVGLREEARLEYRTAHALLRRVLSRYLPGHPKDWVFRSDEEGRPCLANAPGESHLDFNLSHTEGLVACAVTGSGRVGVDVEALDPQRPLDRVVERVLGEQERAWWQGLDPEQQPMAFLDLWTLKEAHFKAWAEGVRWPFSGLEFVLESEDQAHRSGPCAEEVSGQGWYYTRRRPTPQHRMAVAFRGSEKPLWRVASFPA